MFSIYGCLAFAHVLQPEAVSPDVLPYLQANPDEKDVGMTAYISPEQLGFTGVLKQRYSDFIVHEIDMAGNLCVLKDAPGFVDLPAVSAEAPQHAQSSSSANADTVMAVTTTITAKTETQSPDGSNAKETDSAPIEASPVLTELEAESAAIVKGITAMRELLGNETADELQQFLLAVVAEEHSIADDKRYTATMKAQQQQQQQQYKESVDASTNTETTDNASASTAESNEGKKRKADDLLNDTESAVSSSTAQEVMPVSKKAKLDSNDGTTTEAVAEQKLIPLKNAAGRYVHVLPLEVAINKQDRGKVSGLNKAAYNGLLLLYIVASAL
jgi:hypothetical protein